MPALNVHVGFLGSFRLDILFGFGLGFLVKIEAISNICRIEVLHCRGMVTTTQSRATLDVLCRRKTWMLDFSVPSDSISFLGFDMGCYVGLENNIKYLSQGRLFFVVGG